MDQKISDWFASSISYFTISYARSNSFCNIKTFANMKKSTDSWVSLLLRGPSLGRFCLWEKLWFSWLRKYLNVWFAGKKSLLTSKMSQMKVLYVTSNWWGKKSVYLLLRANFNIWKSLFLLNYRAFELKKT